MKTKQQQQQIKGTFFNFLIFKFCHHWARKSFDSTLSFLAWNFENFERKR